MRDWGFSPSADDLHTVTAAVSLYRDHCASFNLPTNAVFDGSIDDVRTLDYLDYVGIAPHGAGIESAAFVCGEVLRRAADLEWMISYRGDWFIATREDSPYEIAISPLARLHELECGSRRRPGMHMWFIQSAAFDCLPFLKGEALRKTCELIQPNGEYLAYMESSLEQLRRAKP